MAQLKEFDDVVDALSVALDTYDKVMADGKVDFGDIGDFPALLVATRNAVVGIKDVPVEVAGASPEDMAASLVKVIDLVKKIIGRMV